MATGLLQSGGVFEWPATPEVGYETWAEMSGMSPGHPLVGGSGPGSLGYGPARGYRQVAIGDAASAGLVGPASGSPANAHFSEILNLKGNPIGWVLIASIIYLGLTHLHVRASVGAGARLR
jgi:hypothetical protein